MPGTIAVAHNIERALSNLLAALSFPQISGCPQHPQQDQEVLDATGRYLGTRGTRFTIR
jgi:hypothetical protein